MSLACICAVSVGDESATGTDSSTPQHDRARTVGALGPWSIAVSVAPVEFGDFAVEVRNVQARGEGKDQYLRTKLRFTNMGRRTATLKDFYRTSVFARGGTGDQLLVADDGCGYSFDDPGDPVQPGVCQLDLRIYEIKRGESFTLMIYAQRGLPGMDPLSAGHFEFDRRVKFQFKDRSVPPVKADLVVSFDVASSSTGRR